MSAATKAKSTLLSIEIPRDELAVRIAEGAIGMRRPPSATPRAALLQMAAVDPDMVRGFYAAADAAVLFFHECINAGRQPS